ncbi:hypothetical protein LCGC14_0938090 [marine sediment metagenome]|uniref:Uncharacterized protein n=1 Tax=marine sediment metagenome TaxID=412755 RepID=A0A0F9RS73_9ZZZZ|nr:hypothetical protein [bacterium]
MSKCNECANWDFLCNHVWQSRRACIDDNFSKFRQMPGVAGNPNPPNFVEDINERLHEHMNIITDFGRKIENLEKKPCMKITRILTDKEIELIERNRVKIDELKEWRHDIAMPRITSLEGNGVDEALDFLVEGHLAEDVEKFEKLIKNDIAKAEALQPDLEYKICYYCEWIEYRWCKHKKETVNVTDTCDNFNPMPIAKFTNEVEKDAS